MKLREGIKNIPVRPISDAWEDYLKLLALNESDIPELLSILKEGEIEKIYGGINEDYSPLHAWRALSQLQAVDAIDTMIDIAIENDDASWLIIEFSRIIPVMGYDVIDKVEVRLTELEESERIDMLNFLIKGLVALAIGDELSQGKIIELLHTQLAEYKFNYDTYNSYLANGLVKLDSHKSIGLIELAMDNDRIHYEEFDEDNFEMLKQTSNE